MAVVWRFNIETRHTPLEEIAKPFDGEEAVVGGDVATEKGRVLKVELEGTEGVQTDGKEAVVEHREI